MKKIKSALISVFYKDNLEPIVKQLHKDGVVIYSTGGTQSFIEGLDIPVVAVEDLTGYPSILGGRVKTLHPKVFGGILSRRGLESDNQQLSEYEIPEIDIVVVDLYPFEETVASTDVEQDIIEKIDIGGISLIRAAAKNFKDVLIVSSREQYDEVRGLLAENNSATSIETRRRFAGYAFDISSHYDSAIFNYFNADQEIDSHKLSLRVSKELRYGENPHQKGFFHGDLSQMFDQLNGKELSYNNLVDVDAAVKLIAEFSGDIAFAIIKHTNACGVALGDSLKEAYLKALAADPVSAFGGILITNQRVDKETAEEIHKLFCEVLIAPDYDQEALQLLSGKKKRVLLKQKVTQSNPFEFKSLLNGVIRQESDLKTDSLEDLKAVTKTVPSDADQRVLLFASKIAKHTKSNTIVLAKNGQMLSSGVGQTSRVDALNQAIKKAKSFDFDLNGSVMASDAFFPFPDCVEIARAEGIKSVIQPGGSIKDQLSIDYCNENEMSMVFTGFRHFYH